MFRTATLSRRRFLSAAIFLPVLFRAARVRAQIDEGRQMPGWSIYGWDGNNFGSSYFFGRVLQLVFVRTDCSSCSSLRNIQVALHNQYEPLGLSTMLVYVGQTNLQVRSYAAAYHLDSTTVTGFNSSFFMVGSTDGILSAMNIGGDSTFPYYFIVDRESIVRLRHVGTTGGSDYIDLLTPYIETYLHHPTLHQIPAGNDVQFEWYKPWGTNVTLEESSSLNPGALWTRRTETPLFTNEFYRITLPREVVGQKFFRLSLPGTNGTNFATAILKRR